MQTLLAEYLPILIFLGLAVFPEKIFHRHPFFAPDFCLGGQRWGWRERRDSNPRPPA